MNFNEMLEIVLESEGVYSYHPADRGARTVFGVSEKWYPDWQGWEILDDILSDYPEYNKQFVGKIPVELEINITHNLKSQVQEWYYNTVFKPLRLEGVSDKLQLLVFDLAVNSGNKRAIKKLQKVIKHFGENIVVDGLIGSKTLEALHRVLINVSDESFCNQYLLERLDVYIEAVVYNKNNKKFFYGWCRRIRKLHNIVTN
jgi:lysozyme family protein